MMFEDVKVGELEIGVLDGEAKPITVSWSSDTGIADRETVYFTPKEARALAEALMKAAKHVDGDDIWVGG